MADARIGTRLSGYLIERLLGRGGMSVVYLAHDERLDRRVALKVMAPELAEDESYRRRFIRESMVAAGIDHPNIIPVHDAGEAQGVLFIAMRYVDGPDLRSLIHSEGPLDIARAISIVDQASGALDAAHRRGLVHRDVKPANILLDPTAGARDHVYLADFGLTKRTLSGSGSTSIGELVGTINYMAPEQIKGDAIDGRADEYSLGCVLFECLTGQPPYEGKQDVAILWSHVAGETPLVTSQRPDLPEQIDSVVGKALAKAPGDRYPTCSDMAAAARESLGAATTVPAGWSRQRPRSPGPTRGAWKPRWRPTALVGAILAVGNTTAILLTSRGGGCGTLPIGSRGAVVKIDPSSGCATMSVPTGSNPFALSLGKGFLWTLNKGDQTVAKVDPPSGRVLLRQRTDGPPIGIATEVVGVWVADGNTGDSLTRFDSRLQKDIAIPVRSGTTGLAGGSGYVWLTNANDGVLLQIDPGTNGEIGSVGVGQAPGPVVTGGGFVWVADSLAPSVWKVDTKLSVRGPFRVPGPPSALTYGAGSLWVTIDSKDEVVRLAPTGRRVTTVPVGDGPTGVSVGEGFVWVANGADGTVSKVDPRTNQVVDTIDVGNSPQAVVAGGGAIWVAVSP